MWAIAAPARAASIAASAIAAGVTGTLSDLPTVSPAPVTAQVMKTSRFTASAIASPFEDAIFARPRARLNRRAPAASAIALGAAAARPALLRLLRRRTRWRRVCGRRLRRRGARLGLGRGRVLDRRRGR